MTDWLLELLLVTFLVCLPIGTIGFLILCGIVYGTEVKDNLTNTAIRLMEWRDTKLKRVIDEELCRHGLSSDGVLSTLLGFDHFSFAMDGKVCTCVKREDGTYDFGFPTPRCVTELQEAEERVERAVAIANEGRAQGEAERAERQTRTADGTAFEAGGALITVTGDQPC